MILSIPYKALARCNLEELGAHVAANNRRAGQPLGGIAFARKEDTVEKDAAREKILHLLELGSADGPQRVLSMPGLSWFFEAQLLKQREPGWRKQKTTTTVELTCVENDRFVYYSAATKMPGNKSTVIRTLPRPPYAERCMGNGMVSRYVFADVDDLLQDRRECFDFAWLDYTGPLSVERMRKISEFWLIGQAKTLVVTSLKARWNKETGRAMERRGGPAGWLRARLPGTELHCVEYQDGASPMIQFAVTRERLTP